MAKDKTTVSTFLEDLTKKMAPLGDADLDSFRELKGDKEIVLSDYSFLSNAVERETFSVDHEKLKEYFPLDTVIDGMLEIYQTILGFTFTQVENAHVWHEEVTLWEVRDTKSKELAGVSLPLIASSLASFDSRSAMRRTLNAQYFYMDLHPREGKYGHAACFTLQSGATLADGTVQPPVAACVCNFSKAQGDKPSLMRHTEVVTIFHEFVRFAEREESAMRYSTVVWYEEDAR